MNHHTCKTFPVDRAYRQPYQLTRHAIFPIESRNTRLTATLHSAGSVDSTGDPLVCECDDAITVYVRFGAKSDNIFYLIINI